MCENKNLSQTLDDNELDKVSGGASDEAFLDEDRIPLGWSVTCFDCHTVFQVSEGECPHCKSKHVLMTF